jgi:transmembrane sensor
MAASLALFLALPAAPDYATKVGEQRQVRLADGSLAALNTDSQLDVAYSTGRRDLTLRQGEAWFQVAHNAARPFEVHVGPVHVRATGTAFSVRRADKGCGSSSPKGACWRGSMARAASLSPLPVATGPC